MSIRPLVLGLALATPWFAQASDSINNSLFSCSAALNFANGTGLEAHCAGNFSVTGGTWTSDTKIALSADGDITLDGVTMNAPALDIHALQQVTITSSTVLQISGDVKVQAGSFAPPPTLGGNPDRPLVPRPGGSVQTGGSDGTAGSPDGSGDLTLQAGAGNGSGSSGSSGGSGGSGGGSIQVRDSGGNLNIHDPSGGISPTISSVPEPETCALALAALASLGTGSALARRRRA